MSRSWRVSSALSITILGLLAMPLLAQAAAPSGDNFVFQTFSQPDGKVIFIGGAENGADEGRTFRTYIARLDASGKIDPTYGDDGYRFTPEVDSSYDQSDYFVRSYASTGDGKIVIGAGPRVFQFDASGQPDATFGQNGSIAHGVDYSTHGWLDVAPDGRIAVTGRDDSLQLTVRMFEADGSPDEAFGPDGKVHLPPLLFPGSGETTSLYQGPIKFDSNGRIVQSVAYTANGDDVDHYGSRRSGVGAFRFLPDGSADPSFGTGSGFAQFAGPFGGERPEYSRPDNLEIQANDDLGIYGRYSVGPTIPPKPYGQESLGVEPMESSDYLSSLSSDGTVATGPSVPRSGAGPFGLDDIAADGSGGFYGNVRYLPPPKSPTDVDFATTGHFAADALLIPAFGQNGLTTVRTGDWTLGISVEADPAGRVVTGGRATVECVGSVAMISRTSATGTPDLTFGDQGVATFPDIETLVPPAGGCAPPRIMPVPVVRAKFQGKRFSRSRLEIKVRAVKRESDFLERWTEARVIFPPGLRPRAAAARRIVVRAGLGPEAARVVRKRISYKGRILTIDRPYSLEPPDLRVIVPTRLLRPVKARSRGRKVTIRATFGRWNGSDSAPRTRGSGKVRIPR